MTMISRSPVSPSAIFFRVNSIQKPYKKSPYTLTKLLASLYNSGSCLLFVPFAIRFDPGSGQYKVENRSKLFRILVGVQQLNVILCYVWSIFLGDKAYMFDTGNTGEFNQRFIQVLKFVTMLMLICMFWVLWTSNHILSKILDQIHHLSISIGQHGEPICSAKTIRLLSIVTILYTFSWGLFDSIVFMNIHTRGLYGSYCHAVDNFRASIQLIPKAHNETEVFISCQNMSVAQRSLTLLFFWTNIVSEYADHFLGVICLVHALVMYYLVSSFIKHLPLNNVPDMGQVKSAFQIFHELCKFSEMIDGMIGSLIFSNVLGFIPYYSRSVFELFQLTFVKVVRKLMYYVKVGGCLLIAAEANSKVNHFIGWFQSLQTRNMKFEDGTEQNNFHTTVTISLGQIQQNKVGLGGKCFTITYGFVVSVVGLIVTYGIIFTQFQPSQPSN